MLDNKNDFFNQGNNENNTQDYFKNQTQPNNQYYSNPNVHYPYMQSKPKKANSKKNFIGFAATVIAISFIFSMAGTIIGNNLLPKNSAISNQATEKLPQDNMGFIQTANSSGKVLTIEQVAEVASKSIVEITTESLTTGNRMQQYVSTGAGSGVIFSEDGYIVTNNHVITDSTKITVTLKDGAQHPATLVGTDVKTDIAVIQIDATDLSPATFGNSSTLKVGQDAIAIGNPLGQLGGTVTNGIISALDREITIDGEVMNLLQTNVAINPGNSGGGLFNIKGELVGIVNAKSSGSDVEGLGFAIPVDAAKPIIEDLIKFGYVQGRVELGVSLVDIQDALTAMMYHVSNAGVYILSVDNNSSAAEAGLQKGDKIIFIDDVNVKTSSDITAILDKHSIGDKIIIGIKRGSKTGTATITLQERKIGTIL